MTVTGPRSCNFGSELDDRVIRLGISDVDDSKARPRRLTPYKFGECPNFAAWDAGNEQGVERLGVAVPERLSLDQILLELHEERSVVLRVASKAAGVQRRQLGSNTDCVDRRDHGPWAQCQLGGEVAREGRRPFGISGEHS